MRLARLIILLSIFLSACQAAPKLPPRIVFFNQGASGLTTVYAISPDGSGLKSLTTLKDLTDTTTHVTAAAISFDGQKVAYVKDGDVYVITVDGNNLTKLTQWNGASADRILIGSLTWSPDNQRIAFIAGLLSGYIVGSNVYSVTTYGINPLDAPKGDGNYQTNPTWSPDSQQIIFLQITKEETRPDSMKIMKFNLKDGQKAVRINDSQYDAQDRTHCDKESSLCPNYGDLAISSDGSKLVFTIHSAVRGSEIDMSAADGSGREKLTDNTALNNYPRWSPDGKKILFLSDRNRALGQYAIYTMNIDGSQQTLLTNDVLQDDSIQAITWSPDSQKIIFASNRIGDWNLYSMNTDGSHQTRLTTIPGKKWGTVWVP